MPQISDLFFHSNIHFISHIGGFNSFFHSYFLSLCQSHKLIHTDILTALYNSFLLIFFLSHFFNRTNAKSIGTGEITTTKLIQVLFSYVLNDCFLGELVTNTILYFSFTHLGLKQKHTLTLRQTNKYTQMKVECS